MNKEELRNYVTNLFKKARDLKKKLEKLEMGIKTQSHRRICTVWYHHFSPTSSEFKKISKTGRISTKEIMNELKISKPTAIEIGKVIRYLLLTEEVSRTLDKGLHAARVWEIYRREFPRDARKVYKRKRAYPKRTYHARMNNEQDEANTQTF